MARRVGLALLLALALIVLLIAGSIGFAQTGLGKRMIADGLGDLLSTPESTVEIAGLQGTVPIDMRLRRVTVADRDGVWLAVDDARLAWSPTALLRGRIREGHNEVLVPIFLNAGVLFAVVLGLMVIAVWESYDAAKTTVSHEAATLVTLYRTTYGLPEETGDKLRAMASKYAKAVIEEEWPLQAARGEAAHATGGCVRPA